MYDQVSCRTNPVFSRTLKPFKKKDSHEVKEYGNCCCHLQNKVFSTGFAEIAKSKTCRRMSIKLLVFFLCTSGFLYQTWAFLQMYLAYPTTLDTSEEYPDSFIEPAVSLCLKNRIFRQPYCRTYPEECTYEHATWESFCNRYRRMCPETEPLGFNFGIPVFKHLHELNSSNTFLNAVGPYEVSYLIHNCHLIGYSVNPPCRSSPTIIQVSKTGLPYRCFSLFSLLSKPHEEISNVSMTDGYYFQLEMRPEEHFNTIDSIEASVVLHDPRKAVNPLTEGVTLTAGKYHQLFPTMDRKESLPPPYASICMDYLKEWKKNGGTGPLSKDDCINLCKIEAMLTEHGCVGKTMTYPNNFPICETLEIFASSDDSRKCSSICRDACEENIYHVTSELKLDIQGSCNETDEYCKNRYMMIQISFNRMKIKKFKQIPRIESIELFSYIGGFLGMWLGISLASLFDLAEMIYDVIGYVFLKRKTDQKTITPIEQFGPHTAVKK